MSSLLVYMPTSVECILGLLHSKGLWWFDFKVDLIIFLQNISIDLFELMVLTFISPSAADDVKHNLHTEECIDISNV